jgi:guanosine-3',5'-bis(diphosphate) 3'-pyrophosphohydrolase
LNSQTSLLEAIAFAAEKHRYQRRKDTDATPYINHVIAVAMVLAVEGGVTSEELLLAAVLHDTVEDTDTSFAELEVRFGPTVAGLVREVTDDKTLKKEQRKQRQVDLAPHASERAKQLKIADKICNIRDIMYHPPAHWELARRQEYLRWSTRVVAGCRGVNPRLDRAYDKTATEAARHLEMDAE